MKIKRLNEDQWSERDKQFLDLLETDQGFEEIVFKLRKKYQITKDYHMPVEDYKEINRVSHDLIELFSLPSSWQQPLVHFIAYDKFIYSGEGVNLNGKTYDNHGRVNDLLITASKSISWDIFYKWILSNKVAIKAHLEELPFEGNIVKTSFELKLEVYKLRKEGYKPAKIEKLLEEKYKDNSEILDKVTGPNISRWINQLKNLLNRTKQK